MKFTDLVRQIAQDRGGWHLPEFYIAEVQRRTGHRIHHGTVISAIGTHDSRASMTPAHAKHNARMLLEDCGDDPNLARWVLNSVAKDQVDHQVRSV